MIIWRGYGILIPIVILTICLMTQYSLDFIFYEGYYQLQKWPVSSDLFLSAAIIWVVGKRLNKDCDRFLLDPKTCRELKPKKAHSLFWLRTEYWAPILALLGSWNLILG